MCFGIAHTVNIRVANQRGKNMWINTTNSNSKFKKMNGLDGKLLVAIEMEWILFKDIIIYVDILSVCLILILNQTQQTVIEKYNLY